MKPIAVEIKGCKAEITNIYAVPVDESAFAQATRQLWPGGGPDPEPEDKLMVLIKFLEPVMVGDYGISAIGANISARSYQRLEFIGEVCREGKLQLERTVNTQIARKNGEDAAVARKAKVEAVVKEIESMLKL